MRIFEKRRIYLGLSAALALLSLLFIALTPFGQGLKPGIDFTGGSVVEVAFRDRSVTREQVVQALNAEGIRDAVVRIGRSEQDWTRVTVTAADVDALTVSRIRERLSEGEGLASFDPGAYQAGAPGKTFSATAVYTAPVKEAQVRAALGATRNAGDRAISLNQLQVTATPESHAGEAAVPIAEVTTRQLPPSQLQKVRESLGRIGGGAIEPMSRATSIGPSIAAEVTQNGIFSAVIASLAMLLFLAFRFAIGGFGNGLKFGAGAVVALFHDVFITIGLFAVMGVLAGWQVDSLFLTACLGLLGFSVNDTIVIYDRIRENLGRRRKGETFAEVSDRSMTESFDRSVNTSFAIMLALAAMVVFGGETLRLFNIALLFGMAIGTYSSVFVATPLVVLLARQAEAGESGTRPTATPTAASTSGRPPERVGVGASTPAEPPAPTDGEDRLEPTMEVPRPPSGSGTIRPNRKRRL
ncbi:MAG TPA: protein translocase subunit SecF, partial [Armatimonadota bacterium]|nr:protein translocase subunit SecF [Armatimonadota bacterium]